jgi:hypothetical protein
MKINKMQIVYIVLFIITPFSCIIFPFAFGIYTIYKKNKKDSN